MSQRLETQQSADFNFIAFSQTPEYVNANYELLKIAFGFLPTSFTHVDVATGTGLVPSLVARLCEEQGKYGFVLGIEPDKFVLNSAMKAVRDTDRCKFQFVQGYAQETEAYAEKVNLVSIHDAIHEIYQPEEKERALKSMAHTLAPGGIMSYNSAFTTMAMIDSAIAHGRWKNLSFLELGKKRNKGAAVMPYLSPEDYLEMITNAVRKSGGTPVVVHDFLRSVTLSRTALEGISRYPAFINGFFADMTDTEEISLGEKSGALIKALDNGNITSLARTWHEAIVQKM